MPPYSSNSNKNCKILWNHTYLQVHILFEVLRYYSNHIKWSGIRHSVPVIDIFKVRCTWESILQLKKIFFFKPHAWFRSYFFFFTWWNAWPNCIWLENCPFLTVCAPFTYQVLKPISKCFCRNAFLTFTIRNIYKKYSLNYIFRIRLASHFRANYIFQHLLNCIIRNSSNRFTLLYSESVLSRILWRIVRQVGWMEAMEMKRRRRSKGDIRNTEIRAIAVEEISFVYVSDAFKVAVMQVCT